VDIRSFSLVFGVVSLRLSLGTSSALEGSVASRKLLGRAASPPAVAFRSRTGHASRPATEIEPCFLSPGLPRSKVQ
jgi:hypothetical protein